MKRRRVREEKLTWNSGGEYGYLLRAADSMIQDHARAAWKECLNDIILFVRQRYRNGREYGGLAIDVTSSFGHRSFSLLKVFYDDLDLDEHNPNATESIRRFANQLLTLCDQHDKRFGANQ